MYYIGVDLGTSAVKLLLMEESGKICKYRIKRISAVFSHIRAGQNRIRKTGLRRAVEGMKELTEGIDRISR